MKGWVATLVRTMPCPTCGALSRERCKSGGLGVATHNVHAARRKAWIAWSEGEHRKAQEEAL